MSVPFSAFSNRFSLFVCFGFVILFSVSALADLDTESEKRTRLDFDGDGIADVAVRRISNSTWYIKNSSGIDKWTSHDDGITRRVFGKQAEDIPVPADYDGDGITDIAVRRPSTATWYIINSSGVDALTGNADGITRRVFGKQATDIPVVADYDGDGKADIAVRRPSNFTWYILNSSGEDALTGNADGITRRVFGKQANDIPVVADYDGDGKVDIAVRRVSNFTWYILNSSGTDTLTENADGITRRVFGKGEKDIAIPADYDGDGKTDIAVRRPSTYTWYVLNSSGKDALSNHEDGITRRVFGKQSTDIPVPADYDGDSKADLAVRRPESGIFYILNSSGSNYNSSKEDGIQRISFGRQDSDIAINAPQTSIIEQIDEQNEPQEPENTPPVANAGADQTVSSQTQVILTGSATDSDGTIATYKWQQTSGRAVTVENSNGAEASFIAPEVDENTALTFALTVTDNDGAEDTDSVTITVQPAASAGEFTVNAGADFTIPATSVAELNGEVSIPASDIASIAWSSNSDTLAIDNSDSLQANVIIEESLAGTSHTFILTVADNNGVSMSDSVTVTVSEVIGFVDFEGELDPDPISDIDVDISVANDQLTPAQTSVHGYQTVVVSENSAFNFTVDGTRLTLEGNLTETLSVGDVLAGVTSDGQSGYLRKITSISGNQYTTERAAITEAFPNADISLSIAPFNDTANQKTQFSRYYNLPPQYKGGQIDVLNIERTVQTELIPGVTNVMEFSVNSALDIDFALKISEGEIIELSTISNTVVEIGSYTTISAEREYIKKYSKAFKPIFDVNRVVFVGAIPVLVNVQAVPSIGANLNFHGSSSIVFGVTNQSDMRAGFEYKNDEITYIDDVTNQFATVGPELTLEGGVGAGVEAKIAYIVSLYEVEVGIPSVGELEFDGPGVGINVGPYFSLDVTAIYQPDNTPSLTCEASLVGGLNSALTIDYGTIGQYLDISEPEDVPLFDFKKDIWSSKECPFDTNLGSMHGHVVDALYYLEGARVSLTDVNEVVIAETLTNEDGYFEFKDLQEGIYTLAFELEGYETGERLGYILGGEDLNYGDNELLHDGNGEPGTLRLDINDLAQPSNSLSGAEVSIRRGYNLPDGDIIQMVTSTGNRQDISVPVGFYTLEVSKDNYGMRRISIEVKAGEVVEQTVSLLPITPGNLNDTGITWAGNSLYGNNDSCVSDMGLDQDCDHGRDALAELGLLNKIGNGLAGFDYTKLDENGNDLPDSAELWHCVRDNHTGLIWEVKSDDRQSGRYWGVSYPMPLPDGSPPGNFSYTWNRLVDRGNRDALCGFNDWRIPNVFELLSIVNYGQSHPATDTDYFPYTLEGYYSDGESCLYCAGYWTSTPTPGNYSEVYSANSALYTVTMSFGIVQDLPIDRLAAARLVRGQELAVSPRNYTINSDGTVTDHNSGLMWMRCPVNSYVEGGECWEPETEEEREEFVQTFAWEEALLEAQTSSFAGYGDWRLPSKAEIMTLMMNGNGTLDYSYSMIPHSRPFWSSSPSFYNRSDGHYSLGLAVYNGFVGDSTNTIGRRRDIDYDFRVVLVRDAN